MGNLIGRNAAVGNIQMAATSLCRENHEVRLLVGDRPRQTPAHIAVPQQQTTSRDSLVCHLIAHAVEVLTCNPFVTANKTVAQRKSLSLHWPNLGQFGYWNHVNKDNFGVMCFGQSDSKRKDALGTR